ncbi:MAG: hypothetical protein IT431_15450 [Phycisphaerales bacterium]|nr:hypothetical protein [Phycisphaerales bacterium]
MNMKQNFSRSMEVLGAYFRQGVKELASVLYDQGSAAQHAEYGMAFTRTPGEIADGLRGVQRDGAERDTDPPSVLDRYTQPSPAQEVGPDRGGQDREHEAPEMERD